MASFVTEVLAHSGRLEKEDLGTRISRLTRRVEEIKVKGGPAPGDRLKRNPALFVEGPGKEWGAEGRQSGCEQSQVGTLSEKNAKWEGWKYLD